MNSLLWVLVLLGGGSGLVVGIIGSAIGSSFNRRILQDVGLDRLPDDPRERYRLINERCDYVRHWTKLDSYNVSVFVVGLLFLVASLVIEFVEAARRSPVTVEGMPITWIFLLSSVIFITLSLGMLLTRFSFLIHLLQVTPKKNHSIKEESTMEQVKSPVDKNRKKKTNTPIFIWLLMAMPAIGAVMPFVSTKFGVGIVITITIIFTAVAVALAIWEQMKRNSPHT